MAWGSRDAAAFKCLILLALLYGTLSYVAYWIIHMKHVSPLGVDAPLDRFSEARVVEHIRQLSVDIDGRQEGRPGLEAAAKYIRKELEAVAARAGPGYRIEVDESLVNGTFNMLFLRHSVSLGYRNHTNLAMRISSKFSDDHDPSVLINGHFDSPLGSPGAGDCGSCVASMLELARVIIDSNWIPPRPIILLFNGAEELFLLGSHGFVKTHKWSNTVGAFVNIEASGTGGFDLVCQSGPGSWPSYIYAQSVKYPMANSVAQDMFGIIPGDTDYRILAEDYANIPGLDIIFVLGGYFYHTSYDTVERLLPGSIQARGENLFRLTQAFVNSSDVLNADERSLKGASLESMEDRAIFFDYLSLFMVYYSRKFSIILHSMPVVILLLGAFFLHFPNVAVNIWFATLFDFIKGMLFHALSLVFAIVVPVMFAVLRLFFSTQAMNWFAHPILAFLMFVPSSLVGLLLPRTTWGNFGLSQKVSQFKLSIEIISDEVCFWGAFALYSSMTMAYLLAQLGGGGFLTYVLSLSMLISWFSYRIASKHCGRQSVKSLASYLIPMIPCLLYSVYYGGFLVQFLIEKMGMMGSLPQPFGYFVQDAVVAATIGLVTGWCVGPLLPVAGHWLARSSVLQCLVQVTILALALSSQFFPYSVDAPKRVVLQHTFATVGSDMIVSSSYDFAVVDANSFSFLFKNAPEASKFLGIGSGLSEENYNSDGGTWVALFPVSFLFSGSLKFPAEGLKILNHYATLPHVSVRDSVSISETGHRRLHLELHLGSIGEIGEIWVTVLNITGPLSNWSFADYRLPAPESINGGPPSYICRLSGGSNDNWTFWLEANNSESLRMDVAVLDQYLVNDTQRLKNSFPSWADLTAFTTFFSSYYL